MSISPAIPWPWSEYLRLQALVSSPFVNARSRGLDDAATRFLDLVATGELPLCPRDLQDRVENLATNHASKHRHRSRLVRWWAESQESADSNLHTTTEMRHMATAVAMVLPPKDAQILCELAAGASCAAAAARHGMRAGSFKARVSRAKIAFRATPLGQEMRAALNW